MANVITPLLEALEAALDVFKGPAATQAQAEQPLAERQAAVKGYADKLRGDAAKLGVMLGDGSTPLAPEELLGLLGAVQSSAAALVVCLHSLTHQVGAASPAFPSGACPGPRAQRHHAMASGHAATPAPAGWPHAQAAPQVRSHQRRHLGHRPHQGRRRARRPQPSHARHPRHRCATLEPCGLAPVRHTRARRDGHQLLSGGPTVVLVAWCRCCCRCCCCAGAVWDACDAVKKQPLDNKAALFKHLAATIRAAKDAVREVRARRVALAAAAGHWTPSHLSDWLAKLPSPTSMHVCRRWMSWQRRMRRQGVSAGQAELI